MTDTPSNEWLQRNCRRIFLRGLTQMVRIGIHDFELGAAQRIVFDIDLYVPLEASTPSSDKIEEVVDYDFVRATVQQHCRQGHIALQETLCDGLLEALMQHPQVLAARVSTHKPDVYADCPAVGVEVFRAKAPQSLPPQATP